MSDLFSAKVLKSGKNKISFSKHGIYNFLKTELNFRYTKIGKKGYFLKLDSEQTYKVVAFNSIKETFLETINNSSKEILGDIDFSEFKQSFLQKSPINNDDYFSDFLSKDFTLSEDNFHSLSLELDSNYQSQELFKKYSSFMEEEGFSILEEDSKDFRFPDLFCYKKLNETQYIILHREFANILPRETKFDLWIYEAREASWFLRFKMEYPRKTNVKLNFDLEKDLDLYKSQF